MKKILLCLASLWVCDVVAQQFDPMLEFSPGHYLGLGRYTAEDGRTEFYSSYAIFSADVWNLAYNSGVGTSFYNLFFEFDEKQSGSFNFLMMRETPGPGSGFYEGKGFCGSHQCHLKARFEKFELEETITFHPATEHIYRLGSLQYLDENGKACETRWDERMNLVGYSPEEDVEEEREESEEAGEEEVPPQGPQDPHKGFRTRN